MALIFTESFGWSNSYSDYDNYSTWNAGLGASYYGIQGIGTFASNTAFAGDNYATTVQQTNGSAPYFLVPAPSATVFFGVRFNINGQASGANFFLVDPTGYQYPHVQVAINTGGQIIATNYSTGTQIGPTYTATNIGNGWNYIEIGVVLGTSGSVTVRLNGVQVLTGTGNTLNNSAGMANTVGQIAMGGTQFYFSHIYVCDNTTSTNNSFLGEVRVIGSSVTANGVCGFAPVGLANNYLNAAKNPPNPTVDYNSSNTVNTQDTFAISTVSSIYTTVFGVNVKTIVYKTDSGTRKVAPVVVSSATQATGTNATIGTSPREISTVFATDPATGAAWTTAGVSAATVGYKIIM